MKHRRTAALVCAGITLSCASALTPGGMRAQASEEWHCPKSSISVVNEGPDTFRVTGCGQTALYRCAQAQAAVPNTSPQSALVDEAEYRHAQGDQTCTRISPR